MTDQQPLSAERLATQLVLRAGHLPDCGEGAEFPWDCTCDYAGFMDTMGDVLARAAASGPDLRAALAEFMDALVAEAEHEPSLRVLLRRMPEAERARAALATAAPSEPAPTDPCAICRKPRGHAEHQAGNIYYHHTFAAPSEPVSGERLRRAAREALVAWERYFKAVTDEARRAYWPALGRAMDDLNDAWWLASPGDAAPEAGEHDGYGGITNYPTPGDNERNPAPSTEPRDALAGALDVDVLASALWFEGLVDGPTADAARDAAESLEAAYRGLRLAAADREPGS